MSTPHEQALALHERALSAFARTRANDQLSDVGKRVEMAKRFVDYRDQLKGVATTQADQAATRTRTLTRTAFGVPTDPIEAMSYRDALSRAEQIDNPAIAGMKMQQALATGDRLMAKALAAHANNAGWRDVLQTYVNDVPAAGTALNELQALVARQNDPQSMFTDAAHFAPQKPAELAGLDDWNIDTLAASDPVTA